MDIRQWISLILGILCYLFLIIGYYVAVIKQVKNLKYKYVYFVIGGIVYFMVTLGILIVGIRVLI